MTTSSRTTPAIVEQIDRDGYVVLDDVIGHDTLAALNDAVDRTIAATATPFGGNVFLGDRTQRVFNLLSHGAPFVDVPVLPPVLDVIDAVLGSDPLLSSLTAMTTHPGQAEQPLHADDANLPLPRPHDPVALVAITALSDFTVENGGTRVVPGSHRADRRPRPDDAADAGSVEMTAGSVLIYNGSIWHGGGANRSDGRRTGIICNYYAGWLRQEENQLLALPRELVATFPDRLRRLVGYGTYRGLHGHVDGVDPATWFDPDAGSPMIWDRIR
ncbi:MAG: phytanoyl-CoA dioxygenase family protein [Ilumatobacteraceae bacterium]